MRDEEFGTRTKKREFYSGSNVEDPKTPISGLVKKLNQKGIPIELKDCEKKIDYRVGFESRKSTVPFLVDVGENARVEGYVLNHNQSSKLKIELRNYTQVIGSGMPGMIGCRAGDSGVLCEINYRGEADNGVVKTVSDVLREFYGSEIDKELLDKVRAAISKGGITGRPLKEK